MRPCPSLPGKRPGRACAVAVRAALAVAAALGAGGPARAGEWSVEVQPVFMEIYGHDQHVLTVHRLDSDAGSDEKTGVLLDTDSELQYRTEIRWARPNWTWGLDFLWVRASQNAGPLTAGPAGAIDEVDGFEAIKALAVGDSRTTDGSGRVGDHDGGAGDDSAGRIGGHAADRPTTGLRQCRERQAGERKRKNQCFDLHISLPEMK